MRYLILSINAGSSSLKTSLYSAPEDRSKHDLQRLANAEISNINSPPSKLKYIRGDYKNSSELKDVKDHKAAFEHVLNAYLKDENIPEARSKEDIRYACHRVVHGGDFTDDELITRETFHKIEKLSDLAPLHNASAVSLMQACHEHLPAVTNVACFDSGFHQTIPPHISSYMISPSISRDKGLRKYGFHGLSYTYITNSVTAFLSKTTTTTSSSSSLSSSTLPTVNIIALHLGSGASACAIRDGKSLDTSMGLTPVSGLPGSTRSGDIDPSLIFHYTSSASKLSPNSTRDLHISTAEEILNKQSGWKAVAGTADFSEIAKEEGDNTTEQAKLAMDIFVDRVLGYVGSYYVKLEGKVDALVFSGGIGEKSAYLRTRVTEGVRCLGFEIDQSENEKVGDNDEGVVSDITLEREGGGGGNGTRKRGHKVLVCRTDEDWQMAWNTMVHPK